MIFRWKRQEEYDSIFDILIISERTTLSEGSLSSNGVSPEHIDWDDDEDDDTTTTIYTMADYPAENQDTLIYELPEGGKIVCQGEIGRGNYGIVYRGSYELNDIDPVTEVAIKILNNTDMTVGVQADFEREMKIMMVDELIQLMLKVLIYLNLCSRTESQSQEHRQDYYPHGWATIYHNGTRETSIVWGVSVR